MNELLDQIRKIETRIEPGDGKWLHYILLDDVIATIENHAKPSPRDETTAEVDEYYASL